MHDPYKVKLVLFSNTYPFGGGETFLADEVPYLAKEFHRITVFPLYRPADPIREHPDNVDIATPLLPFDHKDKKGLIRKGLFNTAPFFFATKEFFRAVFGKRNKKAGLGKRLHIFFNYFLMLRTILENKKLMEEVVRECCFADKIYFYWGDKSAMLIPFLKKLLRPNVEIMPLFCARFHGSDLYEEAKGYLPFRDMIMEHTDYAIPVSYNGMNYIKKNYNPCPKIIEVWHLGSTHHDENFHNFTVEESNTFRIAGCANTISLKRIDLVVKAIQLIKEDKDAMGIIRERGFDRITYTHFGGGYLLQKLREDTKDEDIDFRGSRPHDEILNFYREEGADLFILASRSEGIPVSIMEAMSYGIPVIATNVGGVSELFRNCPVGYIVDADITAEDLKDQIVEYILLPKEIHRQMKQNSYINWKEEWDAETNYTRFAEELLSV